MGKTLNSSHNPLWTREPNLKDETLATDAVANEMRFMINKLGISRIEMLESDQNEIPLTEFWTHIRGHFKEYCQINVSKFSCMIILFYFLFQMPKTLQCFKRRLCSQSSIY